MVVVSVIVLSSFLSFKLQKGDRMGGNCRVIRCDSIERPTKPYRWIRYPAVESAEWIVSKNIYAISSRSRFTRSITRRAQLVTRPSSRYHSKSNWWSASNARGNRALLHVASRFLASVDGIKRSRRANQSMTEPYCAFDGNGVKLGRWSSIHDSFESLLGHNSPL